MSRSSIFKWMSLALVALSVLLLFAGGVRLAGFDETMDNSDDQQMIDELLKDTKNAEMELQGELDYAGIDIDAEKVVDPIIKIFKIAEDGKLSTRELVSISGDLIQLYKLVKDNRALRQFMGVGLVSDEIDTMITVFRMIIILFYLTLLAGIAVIVLHVLDSRLPGVSVVICHALWIVVYRILVWVEGNMPKGVELKTNLAPVVAFLLSLAAMILWIIRNKTEDVPVRRSVRMPGRSVSSSGRGFVSSSPRRPAVRSAGRRSAGPSADEKVCGNCGNVLRTNALFCPQCGMKYEPPKKTAEPDYYEMEQNESGQTGAAEFCPQCGAELDSDALFCGECGYRRS